MRDLKTEERKLQVRLRGHLRRVKAAHKLYDKEIALLMEMDINQADLIRKMRNGEATIHMCDMIALSRNLICDYADGSLLSELVPDNYTAQIIRIGTPKGNVIDEITEITRLSGAIIEAAQQKHPDRSLIIDLARKISSESGAIEKEMEG